MRRFLDSLTLARNDILFAVSFAKQSFISPDMRNDSGNLEDELRKTSVKISKTNRRKLLKETIAHGLLLWYSIGIQVDYAYSTKIDVVHQKRRKINPV